VIAIDSNGIAVANAVLSKCALDLRDQQSVVRAFSRGVVMMLSLHAYTVVLAGN
jgi:hypothetical protein